MKANDIINGFIVTRVRPVEELDGELYELRHIKTNAKLAYLRREDENKTFCISFKTVPEDDTGVFHILEHSVLNGSDRYPVREPFVELLKSSLNTFLNAMTYPDKTVFPVSSRNEKDFENLMRVYLDAVFHPRIYRAREIFDQEGWHYEPDGEGYIRNGVVLNEMRGAYSSVDTIIDSALSAELYDDSCYRFESGGAPGHIPELSYERFIEVHKKFYHPSNSEIFLDGDLPFEKITGIINDEFLASFGERVCDFSIAEQQPFAPRRRAVPYCVSAGDAAPETTYFAKGWLAARYDEPEKLFALNLLCDYLAGDNDSPLTKAIIEKGLAQNISMYMFDGIMQPSLCMVLRNCEREREAEADEAIISVLRGIVRDGIDVERMSSLLCSLEFHTREMNFGWVPCGVGLALSVLSSWNFGGDPMQSLVSEPHFASLRSKLDKGYFETLIEDIMLSGKSRVDLCVYPDDTLGEKQAQAEREDIAERLEHLSREERREIDERFERLRLAQNTPDSPDALASIPMLELCDVERKPKRIPTELTGGRFIFHELPTRGISYMSMFFPIGNVKREELWLCSLLLNLLGDLNTEKYSSEILSTEKSRLLGAFGAEIARFQSRVSASDCRLYVKASCSALEENAGRAAELISEILLRTKFDNVKKIKDLLLQMLDSLKQAFISNGQLLGISRAGMRSSANGVVAAETGGLSFYRKLSELCNNFDERAPGLIAALEELQGRIFTSSSLMMSVTGRRDAELAEKLLGLFPEGDERGAQCVIEPCASQSEGIEIPSTIAYAVHNVHLSKLGLPRSGAQKVLAKLLSLDYLWQEVRVKGGAYGTGLSFTDNGSLIFYTYRDPNPAAALETYRRSAVYLEDTLTASSDISGIILGTVAQIDPLLTPSAAAARADSMYLSGISYEEQCRIREEVLDTTPAQLLELCSALRQAADINNVCVVGGAEKLKECALDSIESL